ncbi:MAG TPA: sugar kinase [Mucilaginibacter sp.]|nr:sugar kinase [Mucilaginibacter sp.]
MSRIFNGHSRGKVLSFGELLLRITPDAGGNWLRENRLPCYTGGAELNVATALALWGLPSKYFTSLPENGLSQQIVEFLSEKKIDTSAIHYSEGRLGVYYLTTGHDLKHNALIYDRACSSFSNLKVGRIDWRTVLSDVSWLHFSAICPAINQDAADVCGELLETAAEMGITISVDLNYRSKLWQYGKRPDEIMPRLVSHCDVIMGNIWAAEMMLNVEVIPDIHESGQKSIYLKEAQKSSETIMKQYPKCKAVANTFRFDSSEDITYYTSLYDGERFYSSKEYTATSVIDKVGSGDCFMAGMIYGFYNDMDHQTTLEFATAAAFEQLFVQSDATDKTVEDIKKAMQ